MASAAPVVSVDTVCVRGLDCEVRAGQDVAPGVVMVDGGIPVFLDLAAADHAVGGVDVEAGETALYHFISNFYVARVLKFFDELRDGIETF